MGDDRPGGVPAGDPVAGAVGVGDRVVRVATGARRAAFVELTLLWLGTLLVIRAIVRLQTGAGLPQWVLAIVPILFIYAPVALCRWRGVESWDYRLSIPAFRDWPSWRAAFLLNAKAILVIAPFWAVGYHLWQHLLFGLNPGHGLPHDLFTLVAYQVFFVAIPEEFFYRGYLQTRLNEVFPRRFMIFGTPMGWGSVIACVYFAAGHSVVELRWWHFATFFPGMVFAWMRERTNGVVAGALFHATCNIAVVCMDTFYGIPR